MENIQKSYNEAKSHYLAYKMAYALTIQDYLTTIRNILEKCKDKMMSFGVNDYIIVKSPIKNEEMMDVTISDIYMNEDNQIKFGVEQEYGCMRRYHIMYLFEFGENIEALKTITEAMYKKFITQY